MTEKREPLHREQDQAISRRAIAKRLAYVPPVVFAVISTKARPALAASTGPKVPRFPNDPNLH